jgi:hypothetical protein
MEKLDRSKLAAGFEGEAQQQQEVVKMTGKGEGVSIGQHLHWV